MASYDLLKTITIDGTTMGLDENLGKRTYNRTSNGITAANTWIQGATITITEPGVYALVGDWAFQGSSSTSGRTLECVISAKFNGATNFVELNGHSDYYAAGQFFKRMEVSWIYHFTSAQVPAQVAVFGRSNLTSAATDTRMLAFKLIYLGGVVKRLKTLANTTLYAPCFGRGVA